MPIYAFLSGANQTCQAGVVVNARADGDFSKFTGVTVDGVPLTADRDYTAWSGSTYVRLLSTYTATLAQGNHTMTVHYTDGSVATTFTISAPPTTTTGGTTTTPTDGTAASPQTGDVGILLWTALCVASGAALIVVRTRKGRGFSD